MAKLKSFFTAIKSSNKEKVVSYLQEDESLLEKENIDGWSAIHVAAAYGDAEIIDLLVDRYNANINARTEGFYTPSMLAAKKNNIKCLKALFNHKADMSLTNISNMDVVSFLSEHDDNLKNLLTNVYEADLSSDEEGDLTVLIGGTIPYPIESF